MTSPLFTPFTLNRLAPRSRWVMPAMQRGICAAGKRIAEKIEKGGEGFDASTEALLKAVGLG